MLMNGEVIMWVFGLVFVCFTTLTSVIWSQLNRRIEAIEESAREDREQMLHLTERIFDKIDKVDHSCKKMVLNIARNYVRKDEL